MSTEKTNNSAYLVIREKLKKLGVNAPPVVAPAGAVALSTAAQILANTAAQLVGQMVKPLKKKQWKPEQTAQATLQALNFAQMADTVMEAAGKAAAREQAMDRAEGESEPEVIAGKVAVPAQLIDMLSAKWRSVADQERARGRSDYADTLTGAANELKLLVDDFTGREPVRG